MFKKILFERTFLQPAWWDGRATVEIWKTVRLPYLLKSVKSIVSGKSLLLISKVLTLFVNALSKFHLHRTLWQAAWWTATSTVQIWRTPPLTVIDRCESNCVGESPSYWYIKCQNCFLRHWLAVRSNPFVIETIYSSHFRCDYLRNQKYFLNFFPIF